MRQTDNIENRLHGFSIIEEKLLMMSIKVLVVIIEKR